MGNSIEVLPTSRDQALEEYYRLRVQYDALSIRILQLKEFIFGYKTIPASAVQITHEHKPSPMARPASNRQPPQVELRIVDALRQYESGATVREMYTLLDGVFKQDTIYEALARMKTRGIVRAIKVDKVQARKFELCVIADASRNGNLGTTNASAENHAAPAK